MSRKIFSRQQQAGGAGVSVVATSGTQNEATGASLVLNTPSGTTDGHLMVAFMASSSTQNSTFSAPAGWSAGPAMAQSPNIAVFYKVASSEPGSRTFTFSRTNSLLSGVIVTLRNAKWGTDWGTNRSSNGGTSLTVTGGSIGFAAYYALICTSVTDGTTFFTTPTDFSAVFNDSTGSAPSLNVFGALVDNPTFANAPNVSVPTNASTASSIGGTYLAVVSTDLAELSATSETIATAPSNLITSTSASVLSGNGTYTTASGVELSKNGGAWTTTGTITTGDTFRVRATSSASWNASTNHDAFIAGSRFRLTLTTTDTVLYTTAGAATYTVPQGVTSLTIGGVGGGGGGTTGVAGTGYGGAGGGSFAGRNNFAVTPGETLNITVGAGGALASAGGTTSVTRASNGQVIISAPGGARGPASALGGAGGTAGTGDAGLVWAGGSGSVGNGAFGGYGGSAAQPDTAGEPRLGTFTAASNRDFASGGGAPGGGLVFGTTNFWYFTDPKEWSYDNDFGSAPPGGPGQNYGGGGGGGGGGPTSGGVGAPGAAIIMLNSRTFNSAAYNANNLATSAAIGQTILTSSTASTNTVTFNINLGAGTNKTVCGFIWFRHSASSTAINGPATGSLLSVGGSGTAWFGSTSTSTIYNISHRVQWWALSSPTSLTTTTAIANTSTAFTDVAFVSKNLTGLFYMPIPFHTAGAAVASSTATTYRFLRPYDVSYQGTLSSDTVAKTYGGTSGVTVSQQSGRYAYGFARRSAASTNATFTTTWGANTIADRININRYTYDYGQTS